MPETKVEYSAKTMEIEQIPMTAILKPVINMRERIDSEGIRALANDIEKNGLINPITVQKVKKKYVLVAGLRRYLAHEVLERATIPGIVRQLTGDEVIRVMFSENAQRENPSVFDEAKFLKHAQTQFGMTLAELGALIGKAKSYVSERLAILDYPDDVSLALEDGKINFSVAREFSKITDDKVRRNYLNYSFSNGITPKVARQWVHEWKTSLNRDEAVTEEEIVEKRGEPQKVRKFLYPCSLCEEPHEMADLTHLNACPDCMKILAGDEEEAPSKDTLNPNP